MTRQEQQEAITRLTEEQISLRAIMAESDAHAAKCIKLGKTFKKEYPEEYEQYETARERYNAIDGELTALEAAQIDVEEMPAMTEQEAGDETAK